MNSTADVEKMFLANPPSAGRKVVIVFHCEFSAHRAPRMYVFVFVFFVNLFEVGLLMVFLF